MATEGERALEAEAKTSMVGVGWRVYQQVAAVIGAFAIFAFLTNFMDFDWRGWLNALVTLWDDFVRPPVHWVFHYAVEVPAHWVGWNIEVPQWLRDYFAVGFVLTASLIRAFVVDRGDIDRVLAFVRSKEGVFVVVMCTVSWPAFLLAYLAVAIERAVRRDPSSLFFVTVISPAIYAGGLLAINSVQVALTETPTTTWSGTIYNDTGVAVNLRSGPAMDYPSVYQYPVDGGQQVTVTCLVDGGWWEYPDESGGSYTWYKVASPDGYVATAYVDVSGADVRACDSE